MKILTANFVTCAVKSCKRTTASFPLHFKDAELVQSSLEFNPDFILNILPRIEWPALLTTATELGFTTLPQDKPENLTPENENDEQTLKDLHTLLLETEVNNGKLVCGNCGHEYHIMQGITNFLLPSHLV